MSKIKQLHLQERPHWFTCGCFPLWRYPVATRLTAYVRWYGKRHQWEALVIHCGRVRRALLRFDSLVDAMDWCEQASAAALARQEERAKKRGAK